MNGVCTLFYQFIRLRVDGKVAADGGKWLEAAVYEVDLVGMDPRLAKRVGRQQVDVDVLAGNDDGAVVRAFRYKLLPLPVGYYQRYRNGSHGEAVVHIQVDVGFIALLVGPQV